MRLLSEIPRKLRAPCGREGLGVAGGTFSLRESGKNRRVPASQHENLPFNLEKALDNDRLELCSDSVASCGEFLHFSHKLV